MCLLWNSARFVLQPEGQGNCMPPLEVVFIGHGAAAAAAAASCAAFTLWACASIGTTIRAHTLLSAPCHPLPRSLRNYLHANGTSNLFIRLGDVPMNSDACCLSLGPHSIVDVDASTLRARALAADAADINDATFVGSGDSKTASETLRKSLALCCIQRQSGHS
jgi:hypothetical protein